MEMNRSYFSKEYWRSLIIAIYTFFYLFFYTLFFPMENQRNNSNTGLGNRGGYNSGNRRNVQGFSGRGQSQFQGGMRFGGSGLGGG